MSEPARDEPRAPRLFDPPAPAPAGGARAHSNAITEDLDEAPRAPELFDPPLQAVEAADGTRFRCTTVEEERLLSRLFPRPGCTLAMGGALYGAFAKIGMRAKRRPLRPSDWFEASRADLADELNLRSQRTLGPYLNALREGGLLERRRRRRGANLWRLPQYRVDSRKATDCLSSDQGRQPVAFRAPLGRQPVAHPLRENNTADKNNVVRMPGRDERHRSRRESPSDLLMEIWGGS